MSNALQFHECAVHWTPQLKRLVSLDMSMHEDILLNLNLLSIWKEAGYVSAQFFQY